MNSSTDRAAVKERSGSIERLLTVNQSRMQKKNHLCSKKKRDT